MACNLTNKIHEADLCVVGGGLAGMCAAIASARQGLKVVLMHDRPVLGGNASSEIRMWVCGAHGKNNRETGIVEEIALENMYRNPYRTYPIWDTVLFESVMREKNITLLLNCSCMELEMSGTKIKSIKGWQTTTQKYHTVNAIYFADCSGDSILAPLSGAEYRLGRESRSEFDESISPVDGDLKTMGLSCLIQARETDEKHTFTPPEWAYKYTKEDLPHRIPDLGNEYENFWYLELGGENDSIGDTEEIRDELLRTALGVWDFVKNSGECNADNWELDFLGFLPGKRESRRYVGDYIMTQHDVEGEGRFEDIISYGGWTMDDHDPAGFKTKGVPNIFHPAPSPFGIPYRCIYSKNIDNLFFAGRNISVTHSALSATRVMATCATLGQALGTAAAFAKKYGLSPRGVYEEKISELKQNLMEQDCYIPFNKMKMSDLMINSEITAECDEPKRLISGIDRDIETDSISVKTGSQIVIDFKKVTEIKNIRLIFNSDLNRTTTGGGRMNQKMTICNIPKNHSQIHLPDTLVSDMDIFFKDEENTWHKLTEIKNNHQRLVNVNTTCTAAAIKLVPTKVFKGSYADIFSVNIK